MSRVYLAAISLGALLAAAAAALGIAACGPGPQIYSCSIPAIGELGADGGPDPCHCNVGDDGTSCNCTSPGDGMLFFQQCIYTLSMYDAGDGGLEGGP